MSTPDPSNPSGCHPRVRPLLVCPRCRGELRDRTDGLACVPCGRLYPVVDGVPYMTEEDSARLPVDPRTPRR